MNQADKTQRTVAIGDELYFVKDGDAHYGIVAAVGKDGVTIDAQEPDGTTATHQVFHKDVIGHRRRAERRMTVIDRGEDGAIAVDDHGRRVFLHGSLDDAEEPIAKAMPGELQTTEDQRILSAVRAALEPIHTTVQAMQAAHHREMERLAHVIELLAGKPLPVVEVNLPEQLPPAVSITLPEHPAPVINLPAQAPPTVIVETPARKTITEIERNRDGDIVRAVQTEVEQ